MYTNLRATIQEVGRVRLTGPCLVTGAEHSVVVSQEGTLAYFHHGATAREAFPELPKEEREFLISGTSPDGWRKLFGNAKNANARQA